MKDPVEVAGRGLSSVVVESTILFLFWILPDFPLLWMDPLGADSSDSVALTMCYMSRLVCRLKVVCSFLLFHRTPETFCMLLTC